MSGASTSNDESVCEICHITGDPPFVCWWEGPLVSRQIDEIESELMQNQEWRSELLSRGDGIYRFSVVFVDAQVELCGGVERVTDESHWLLSFVSYRTFESEQS